ncbi:MAG TPA: ATP-binding protein [Gemmatimonadaceae bacterium]
MSDSARALTEIVRELTRMRDPERLFAVVARHAATLVGAGAGRVAIRDGDGFVVRGAWGDGAPGIGARLPIAGTIGGEAMTTGRPVRAPDVRTSAARWPFTAHTVAPHTCNALAVPLVAGSDASGCIVVFAAPSRTFDEGDEALLLALADYAAIGAENARLMERERRQRIDADAASAIARLALATSSVEEMGEAILETLEVVLPSSGKALAVVTSDGEGAMLEYIAATGVSAPLLGVRIAVADSLAREGMRTHQPVHVHRPGDTAHPSVRDRLSGNDAVLVPLVAQERALGLLAVTTARSVPLPVAELDRLRRLADSVALAVDVRLLQEADRRLAEQLRQTEKLVALGQLVAGVAHEVNNPLTGISAFAELLLEEGLASEEQTESVRLIRKEAARAGRVIRDLLVFARTSGPSHGPVDLNEVVEQALRLRLYGLRASGVEVELDLDHELPLIEGDAAKLQQVVLNLVVNAEHALLKAPQRRLRLRTCHRDGSIVLEVADTGEGMEPEVARRIFEPFFTTKPEGTGTGLGLSVSYGIVQAHGGDVAVDSTPGAGTTFRVVFPLHHPLSSHSTASTSAPAS